MLTDTIKPTVDPAVAAPRARPTDWLARRSTLLIATVVALIGLPYLLAGPGPLADDWVFLRNQRFDGWLHAAGPRQLGRPGGAFVYDVTFGLIGNHPLVLAIVQLALLAAAALAVHAALARFVDHRLALAIVLVWLVAPNHMTLEHWASTAQALVALALLGVGVRLLDEHPERPMAAFVVLALAVSCYEIVAAIALATVFAVPWLRGRRLPTRVLVIGTAIVATPVVWAFTHRTVYARTPGWIDPTLILPGNLSLGLAGYGWQGRLVTGLGLALVIVAALRRWRPSLHHLYGNDERLVLAGAAVLALGVLPVVRFPTNFLGMDDRLTLVSGIGAAMVWVGGVGMVARDRVHARRLTAAATLGLFVIVVSVRADHERDYAAAADAAHAEAVALVAMTDSARVVDVPGPIADADRVFGLHDGWNATAAVQALSGDPRRVAHVDGIGPDPSDPTQPFR